MLFEFVYKKNLNASTPSQIDFEAMFSAPRYQDGTDKKMYNTLCSSVAYFTYPVIYSLKKYRSKHASSTVTCFHFVHYVRALPSSCLSSPFPHWHFTAFLGVEVADCRIENT